MSLQAKTRQRVLRFSLNDGGGALVEIAIVLPILLVLLASVGEFARFFHDYSTLAKAVRTGARYLSARPNASGEITSTKNMVVCGKTAACVANEAVVGGLTTSNVDVTTQGGIASAPEKITVTITGYSFQPVFNLAGLTGVSGLSLAVPISPSVTMRYLVAPN